MYNSRDLSVRGWVVAMADETRERSFCFSLRYLHVDCPCDFAVRLLTLVIVSQVEQYLRLSLYSRDTRICFERRALVSQVPLARRTLRHCPHHVQVSCNGPQIRVRGSLAPRLHILYHLRGCPVEVPIQGKSGGCVRLCQHRG